MRSLSITKLIKLSVSASIRRLGLTESTVILHDQQTRESVMTFVSASTVYGRNSAIVLDKSQSLLWQVGT